ncbi:hypothetical protein ACMFMG_003507 [Clarireedia jacksonii]
MKYSAVILASIMLGQSAMATNIYHPPSVGNVQVRAPDGTSSTKKACKSKSSSASAASSVAASSVAASDAAATSAGPSTVYHTTTILKHTSSTVYVTVTPSAASSTIASTGLATGTGAAYPSGTGAPVKEYNRCGGIGYTGPTNCVEGTVCKVQNPYYSQCVAIA